MKGGSDIIKAAVSYDHIWGLNSNHQLMKCRLPCDSHRRWKILNDVYFETIAVNPFEIWGVDSEHNAYRCQFPCKGKEGFQRVATDVKQVSLGLKQAWLLNLQGRVQWTKVDFAKAPLVIDPPSLKWQGNGGVCSSISVSEDGELWCSTHLQSVYRWDIASHSWRRQHKVKAKRVSVGPEYVFAIAKDQSLMRCLRPCRNGGWELASKEKVRSLSAEWTGLGLVYAILVGGERGKAGLSTGKFGYSKLFEATNRANAYYWTMPVGNGTWLPSNSPYFYPFSLPQQNPTLMLQSPN